MVTGGGKSLPCDPGSELRLGGSEKRRAKIINGMEQKKGKKKKKKKARDEVDHSVCCFACRASPCSPLPTLPGATSAMLASSPGEARCFRSRFFYQLFGSQRTSLSVRNWVVEQVAILPRTFQVYVSNLGQAFFSRRVPLFLFSSF